MKYYLIISAIILIIAVGVIYLQIDNERINNNSIFDLNKIKNFSTADQFLSDKSAPNFIGISKWLNSQPLDIEELRGKVVLVDFWTYSCINCIRTLPYVTSWYEKYKGENFVVVGVHTPEFDFEKRTENVQEALKRYKINYPVAQDNNFATWRAYDNHYWPAKYLIDQNGKIVYSHFGEGEYDATENKIRELLGLEKAIVSEKTANILVKTPEIYFGLNRLEYLVSDITPGNAAKKYEFPRTLPSNHFGLQGHWSFSPEFAELKNVPGKILLDFYARQVNAVAESKTGQPVELIVFIDGKEHKRVRVTGPDLYNLAEFSESSPHIMEIEVLNDGFLIFTFTFG